MSNRNYVKGRNFEYRIIKWLRNKGYYVIRSYGSKGTFDLVAVPPTNSRLSKALLVQAKFSGKNKLQVTADEKARLANEARRYKAFCCLVFNEKRKLKWRLVYPYYYDTRRVHRQDNSGQDGGEDQIQGDTFCKGIKDRDFLGL